MYTVRQDNLSDSYSINEYIFSLNKIVMKLILVHEHGNCFSVFLQILEVIVSHVKTLFHSSLTLWLLFSMHCLLPLHRISSPPPTQLFQGTVNTCLQRNSWACVVTVRRAFCATLRKPLPTAAQRGNYVLTNGVAQWHYDARFPPCFCSLWKKYANRLTMRFKDPNLEAKVLYIT